MNLPRRELVQTIGEGEGQLQPILKSGLRWAFRIMDCRDTRGYDVTLTDNQKRAMIKRVADALEKLGVAGLAVGIFQGNVVGAVCGIAFILSDVFLWNISRQTDCFFFVFDGVAYGPVGSPAGNQSLVV